MKPELIYRACHYTTPWGPSVLQKHRQEWTQQSCPSGMGEYTCCLPIMCAPLDEEPKINKRDESKTTMDHTLIISLSVLTRHQWRSQRSTKRMSPRPSGSYPHQLLLILHLPSMKGYGDEFFFLFSFFFKAFPRNISELKWHCVICEFVSCLKCLSCQWSVSYLLYTVIAYGLPKSPKPHPGLPVSCFK